MPRDGSGNYTYPPGTPGIPDTTIESAKYNGYIADVQADLNLPRPIVAGGTGATNATAARDNLDAERSMQPVTNYDIHPWEAGSFYSAPGATNAPNGTSWFLGIVVADPAVPSKCVIAIDLNATPPLPQYMRSYNGTSWSAWTKQGDIYVDVAGDTMTGNLSISNAGPSLAINSTTATAPVVFGSKSNLNRWSLVLGSAATESGGGTGSHFAIQRHNDAGGAIDIPLVINRTTGMTTLLGDLTVNATASPTGGRVYFGNTATKHLTYDNTNFILNGAPLIVNAAVFSAINTTDGTIAFGSGGAHSLVYTAAGKFVLNDQLIVSGPLVTALNTTDGTLYFGNGGTHYLNYTTAGKFNLNDALLLTSGSIAVGGATLGSAPGAGNSNLGCEMGSYVACNRNGLPAAFFGNNSNGDVVWWTKSGTTVGSVSVSATNTAYNTSSDERLKDDLKTFDAGNVIDKTNVYDFAWKQTGLRDYGILAQQAVEVYPAAVTHNAKEDWWGIDYSKYVPIILQELKTLRERVAALEGGKVPA